MAKNKSAAAAKADTSNGSSTKRNSSTNGTTIAATTASSSSSSLNLSSILIAIMAFGVGILSPPLLKMVQNPSSLSNTSHLETKIRSLLETGNDRPAYACTKESLDQVLHDEYIAGIYVLCFNRDDSNDLRMKVYNGAARTRWTMVEIENGLTMDWPTLQPKLLEQIQLPESPLGMQPWAIFSPLGERVLDAKTKETEGQPLIVHSLVNKLGMGLLYQGGQFIWPGVSIGYERQVSLYSVMPMGSPKFQRNRNVTLETLSLFPLVLSVKGFLSDTECDHIQEVATPSMEYSGVVLMDHDKDKKASDFRTSQTTFLGPVDDTFVDIDYRTASLVRVPRNHQEHVQVLRYGETQYYQAHHDFFTPAFYQQDPATLRLIKDGLRNRLATVFWYLSDVEEGGETAFPRFNRGREKSFDDCETGLLVRPEKGKVIIFYSMTPDGATDQYSLHGACPVKKGIKWAANKWVWNEKMLYTPE